MSDFAIGGRRASALAVGTEVAEGQIVDRNSAWLSAECARMGFAIGGHRCVPDDREAIARALDLLRAESAIVFVTGGLGPTSDDFTREVIAERFGAPLEFDEASWREVQEKLGARGVQAREAQKRQCWFPKGATILPNAAGTANGFRLEADGVRLFALPGPPSEVEAVFEASIRGELACEVPEADRVDLRIWRCLGKGESDLAEIAEACLAGGGMTVGYRAHLPYVEVKVWVPRAQAFAKRPWLDALEKGLAPWLVNRDDEDVVDGVLAAAAAIPGGLRIVDGATGGWLAERVRERSARQKATARIRVETLFELSEGADAEALETEAFAGSAFAGASASLTIAETDRRWRLSWRAGKGAAVHRADISPSFVYAFRSERARKFVCESALRALGEALGGAR